LRAPSFYDEFVECLAGFQLGIKKELFDPTQYFRLRGRVILRQFVAFHDAPEMNDAFDFLIAVFVNQLFGGPVAPEFFELFACRHGEVNDRQRQR